MRCTCRKTAGENKITSLLHNKMMENMGYGQERSKDIVEKEAEEEAKGQ